MANLPSGTVTFLFTDIEGSTKLAQQHRDFWETLRERHHAILRNAIESNNGYVFQIIGDAFCAAFHKAGEALKAALKSQQGLQNEEWDDVPIRVRMGIHTGEAEAYAGEYHGYLTMSLVQRLMSAGHGGQILISDTTEKLLREELPKNVSLRNLGEHKFKDVSYSVRVFQVVTLGLQTQFPALRTEDAHPNNLPTQLTSFVGREKELVDVKKLLFNAHMLTLIGPGGMGKTRLSIQAASEVLDQYPDGVWFVELAPILDPLLVPRTTAMAMSLRDEPQRPVIEMLCDYLREKKMLIILDNCEHLVEACARMADRILHAAPNVRILASSREALGIGGEVTYRVPSLGLPDVNHLPPVESLNQYEALKLFIDRATSAVPGFIVSNDNAPALAQVCHQLDGIPLAIELAAAKVRVLSVDQIAKRLDDRFKLLTGGSRTALERHQTLRAAIDWSYNLLPAAEQVLFSRLSIFFNGWTLEAAESVCANQVVHSDDVLNLLEQLINKSLVMKEEMQGETRYRMLETIRQYASEKMVESGEADELRDRQLEFFLQLAREAEPKLYSAEQVACLNGLEVELDNFRGVLEWSLEEGSAELGMRLAGALWRFWVMRGYWSEGYDWLKKALFKKDGVSAAVRAKALGRAGELALRNRDFVLAHTLLTESLTLCRELGDEGCAAFSLYGFGKLDSFQGNTARARSFFEESLAIYRKLNGKWGIALVLDSLGFLVTQSDPASGRTLREDSLTIFRELSDYWDMMRLLHNVGESARFEGNYARAKALYEEARALGQELGVAKWDLANQLLGLGYSVLREGDSGRAATHFKDSFMLQKEHGALTSLMAPCVAGFGGVAAAQGQLIRAAQLLGAAKSTFAEFEAKGEYIEPVERAEYDHDVAVVHAQLDEATFNAAWEAGKEMNLEEAVVYALEEVK
jgi:predicted ATPase/class 3 adenylate cyclase